VGMNDRDPQWHDLYRVDLRDGTRTLVEKNEQQIGQYFADGELQPRFAMRSRPDGGSDVLQRKGNAWETFDTIGFEDSMTTGPAGLSDDGATLYLRDSR